MFTTKRICSHFCVKSLKLKAFGSRTLFICNRGAVVTFVKAYLMMLCRLHWLCRFQWRDNQLMNRKYVEGTNHGLLWGIPKVAWRDWEKPRENNNQSAVRKMDPWRFEYEAALFPLRWYVLLQIYNSEWLPHFTCLQAKLSRLSI